MVASAAIASTRPVVTSVSLREGQVTLATSLRTSRTNFAGSNATPLMLLKSPSLGQVGRTGDAAPGRHPRGRLGLAGVEGLEPPTSGFGDRRSSQLSYTPPAAAPCVGEAGPEA